VRAVPGLLQLYDLLALVAASVDGVARLVAWEEPWRRVFATTNGRRIAARAPAMAELTCARAGDGSAMTDRFLLLPDIGRLSVATSGRSLRALAQLQRLGEDVPDIVVATRDPERADAWEMQFERLGLSGSARPAALATPWSRAISDACHLAVREARGEKASFTAAGSSVATTVHAIASVAAPPTGAVWSTETVRVDAALNISELAVLDLVGRHAFISSSVVGQVLGRDGRWVAARRRSLARRGLARCFDDGDGPSWERER